ncbi:MAG TPA: tetratricopeptide repeat protein, partial [Ignavibacteriales bacterium]|nr:tetratricopeptide repeat protein [Ignavibacteriales bacterium]
AYEYYSEAIELKPDYFEALKSRGAMKYKRRDFNGAITDMTALLEKYPEQYELYYYRAKAKEALSDYQGANSDYTKALVNPSYAEAYAARGDLRYKLEDFYSAATDYTKAIKINTVNTAFFLKRAAAYKNLNNNDDALIDIEAALRIEPKEAKAYALRGFINYNLRRYKTAGSDWERAVELNPDFRERFDKLIAASRGK